MLRMKSALIRSIGVYMHRASLSLTAQEPCLSHGIDSLLLLAFQTLVKLHLRASFSETSPVVISPLSITFWQISIKAFFGGYIGNPIYNNCLLPCCLTPLSSKRQLLLYFQLNCSESTRQFGSYSFCHAICIVNLCCQIRHAHLSYRKFLEFVKSLTKYFLR